MHSQNLMALKERFFRLHTIEETNVFVTQDFYIRSEVILLSYDNGIENMSWYTALRRFAMIVILKAT